MIARTHVEITTCPECGLPAEVIDRVTLPSTDGPIEHVKTRCVSGEWFMMPAAAAAEATKPLRQAA